MREGIPTERSYSASFRFALLLAVSLLFSYSSRAHEEMGISPNSRTAAKRTPPDSSISQKLSEIYRKSGALTIDDRVLCQEQLERVYYRHRVWPGRKDRPKPPFEELIPLQIVEKKVRDTLKKCALLDEVWKKPITGDQLQAEIDRMVRETLDPETLKELFRALNNDPKLIAECLAMPLVADRKIRELFAEDGRIHAATRVLAEGLQKTLTAETFASCSEGSHQEVAWKKAEDLGQGAEDYCEPVPLSDKEFDAAVAGYPLKPGQIALEESAYSFLLRLTRHRFPDLFDGASITVPKQGFEEWFSLTAPGCELKVFELDQLFQVGEAASCYEPNSWVSVSPPSGIPRNNFGTAVWTGNKMLLWGGTDPGNIHNMGWWYDPTTEASGPISSLSAPDPRYGHTVVWTGSKMIVWGGVYLAVPYDPQSEVPLNTGGIYDPVSDLWVATSGVEAPEPRGGHTAIWTGTEMIVWGGKGAGSTNYLGNGSRFGFNLETQGTWVPTCDPTPDFLGRTGHSAIWTGDRGEMVLWGGRGSGGYSFTNGAIYKPELDSSPPTKQAWEFIPPLGTSTVENHTAVWTGNEMLVWGGWSNNNSMSNSGFSFDLARKRPDSLELTATVGGRMSHEAIWTGSEMLIIGGIGGGANCELVSGCLYHDPPDNSFWYPMSEGIEKAPRCGHYSAIWNGRCAIAFGGAKPGEMSLSALFPDTPPISRPRLRLDGTELLTDSGKMIMDIPSCTQDSSRRLFLSLGHELEPEWYDDIEYQEDGLADKQWQSVPPDSEGGWRVACGESCSGSGDSVSEYCSWRIGSSGTCSYKDLEGKYTLTLNTPDPQPTSLLWKESAMLSFGYYLSLDQEDAGEADLADVRISLDGGNTWRLVASNYDSSEAQVLPLNDNCKEWRHIQIRLANYFSGPQPNSSVKVMFTFECNGIQNDAMGWLLDDIGLGAPAGDGSNPCLMWADSRGNSSSGGAKYRDGCDEASFQWEIDGLKLNSTSTPMLNVPICDSAFEKLRSEGEHYFRLTVHDKANRSASSEMSVKTRTAPAFRFISPADGDILFSSTQDKAEMYNVSWEIPGKLGEIDTIQLSYRSGEDENNAWVEIFSSRWITSFEWRVPTIGEAGNYGQVFPSDSVQFRMRITYSDFGQRSFDFFSPQFSVHEQGVSTLFITNWQRMIELFPEYSETIERVKTKVRMLARDPAINGQVLDAASMRELKNPADLYSIWDANPELAPIANSIAGKIRTKARILYPKTDFIVIVGSDNIVPYYRVDDRTKIATEKEYSNFVDWQTAIGKSMKSGMSYVLSDSFVRWDAQSYKCTISMLENCLESDLPVGRLVETPSEIETAIDAFIEKNGCIDSKEGVMISGYPPFLEDAAESAKDGWCGDLSEADCPVKLLTGDQCTADAVANQMATSSVNSLFQEGNHHFLRAREADCDESDFPASAKGKLFALAGCHGGLSIPDPKSPTPNFTSRDIAQVLLGRGAAGCIGNTGYGWGLKGGIGYSEKLFDLINEKLHGDATMLVGTALRDAKLDYFRSGLRWDAYDEKVLLECTLYGLPMYRMKGSQNRGVISRSQDIVKPELALKNSGCSYDINMPENGPHADSYPEEDIARYLKLRMTEAGQYYEYCPESGLRHSAAKIGESIQPVLKKNIAISNEHGKLHGVMFFSGGFVDSPLGNSFVPVIANPENVAHMPGMIPLAPGMGGLIGTISRTRAVPDQQNESASSEIVPLVIPCAFYSSEDRKERLFDCVKYYAFYSQREGTTPPEIKLRSGACSFHRMYGNDAKFSVSVRGQDAAVALVLVTLTDLTGEWRSYELAQNEETGQWEGSIKTDGPAYYYVQAIDNAGNVSVFSEDVPVKETRDGVQTEIVIYKREKLFKIPLSCLAGDCDGDRMVSIGELQKSINMYLGSAPVDCGVDVNSDGGVSISELQSVIIAFLSE